MVPKNRTKLSEHFEAWEFECPCCGQLPEQGISQELLSRLEALRARIGRPVNVSSGYRCPKRNAQLANAAPESLHLTGEAADIWVAGIDPPAVLLHAHAVGFTGLGLYRTHVHVDVRPNLAAWDAR